MNTSAIMDLINDLESRFAVDTWEAGGIRIWPYLRIKLNFDLYAAYHTDAAAAPRSPSRVVSLVRDLGRFAAASFSDRGRNRRPAGHADVVLISDGVSYAFQDGAWYEKFCDPLIERFSAQGVSTLLVSPSHAYRVPRRTPSYFVQPWIDAARMRNRLFPAEAPANEALTREYHAFRGHLDGLRLKVSAPPFAAVRHYASVLRCTAGVYRSLLERTTPSVVFVVSYYNIEGMAVNLACRALGIPSVDLQHGLEGDLHVAYARWRRVPADGYELLPERFWVWDEQDAAVIRRWSSGPRHLPVIGGNLWLNAWLEGSGPVVADCDRRMLEALEAHPGRKHVLVTLQIGLTDTRTLAELIEAIRTTQHEWRWWLRLHPCMLEQRERVRALFTRHGITDCELDLATDLPLYAILRHVDLHLTHSSTTVIEAQRFGMPSVVISSYGAEFFPAQLASGWAVTAFTSADIRFALRRQLDARTSLRRTTAPPATAERGIDEITAFLRHRGPAGPAPQTDHGGFKQ